MIEAFVSKIHLTFPDGTVKEFEKNVTPLAVAESISPRLAKETLSAIVNDAYVQTTTPLTEDGAIRLLTWNDPEGRMVYWHSSAHLMAQAIKRVWPEAQLGIGPAIDSGFYYDIEVDHKITPDDFPLLEAEMAKIVQDDAPIVRNVLSRDEAIKFFTETNEWLKIDLIEGIDEELSTYSQGEFTDLCRGPHLASTGSISKHFKLLTVAGAYWKGDENNKMLQRLYATSFPKKKQLEEHLHLLEEAKKRDHRKLGKELKLFSINESIGNGLVLWHPKGATIRNIIENFWKDKHQDNGYDLIFTPHIAKYGLWETSGHAGFYNDNMFDQMELEGADYQLKPMNCPFHVAIYNTDMHSYRELPVRYAELGTVYRYERSGVLHGLMRVRGFTQDDAHIFCLPDQAHIEIQNVLKLNAEILGAFGFTDFKVYLSTRPEKSVGSDENWEIAEKALQKAMDAMGMDYTVDPGEGVFYGPKIDIKIKDSLNREWQCSTVQFDFNLPDRFQVEYVGEDGAAHQPIMIHRALFGSIERFFGILIEHYAGNFPVWLAPTQVMIIPITDRVHEYATEIENRFRAAGLRTEVDKRNEKMGYKIREAELMKIPYMIIVGDKEAELGVLSVRSKNEGDLGQLGVDAFIDQATSAVATKQ
jgi:threonyl-tRNA synthetase